MINEFIKENLALHYRMDDSGVLLYDDSLNHNHATLTAATGNMDATGFINGACEFSPGYFANLDRPHTAQDTWLMSVAFRLDTVPTGIATIISNNANTSSISIHSSGAQFRVELNNTPYDMTIPGILSPGVWYRAHILKFYNDANGANRLFGNVWDATGFTPVGSINAPINPTDAAANFVIDTISSSSNPFDGLIDDLRFYEYNERYANFFFVPTPTVSEMFHNEALDFANITVSEGNMLGRLYIPPVLFDRYKLPLYVYFHDETQFGTNNLTPHNTQAVKNLVCTAMGRRDLCGFRNPVTNQLDRVENYMHKPGYPGYVLVLHSPGNWFDPNNIANIEKLIQKIVDDTTNYYIDSKRIALIGNAAGGDLTVASSTLFRTIAPASLADLGVGFINVVPTPYDIAGNNFNVQIYHAVDDAAKSINDVRALVNFADIKRGGWLFTEIPAGNVLHYDTAAYILCGSNNLNSGYGELFYENLFNRVAPNAGLSRRTAYPKPIRGLFAKAQGDHDYHPITPSSGLISTWPSSYGGRVNIVWP